MITTKRGIKKWGVVLLEGILLILAGIYFIAVPGVSLTVIAVIAAIAMCVSGAAQIALGVYNRVLLPNWMWNVCLGAADIFMGFILFCNPGIVAVVLPIVVGIWLFLKSIEEFSIAFDLRDFGDKKWFWNLIAALVTIVVALILIFNPMLGAFTLGVWMGLGCAIVGVIYVYVSLKLRKVQIDARRPEGFRESEPLV